MLEEDSSTTDECICSTLEINVIIQCLFPLFYAECPVSLKPVLMTSNACLLYAFDFLSENLSKINPIICMALFNQDLILQTKDCCTISYI